MRIVIAGLAIAIISAAYFTCPRALRADINEAVAPSEEFVQDVADAVDTVRDYMRGLDSATRS